MLSLIRKRMKGEKGFTLIELLVVIIIIAILAAIAIPTFLGQRQKAQDAAAKSLIRNAMTAIESAYVDARTFDDTQVGMTPADVALIEPSIHFDNTVAAAATAPTAQTSGNTVNYKGTATSYQVGSQSASGKLFGVDVNKGSANDALGNAPGNTFYVAGAIHSW
jgi:type IV pilus assembly protein PilA